MLGWVELTALGLLVGAFGTLIGAGGGFVLVPLLLLVYPHEAPEVLTSISLAVIFFNAASGSWAYARMARIDYRAAAVLAAASIPGAVLGALTTQAIARRQFDALLGLLILVLAMLLLTRPRAGHGPGSRADPAPATGPAANTSGRAARRRQLRLGAVLSVGVGYLSSLLGIGGGIVHVPVLVRLLHFPVHVATATSHLVLAAMALAGTVAHIAAGDFYHGVRRAGALGLGAVIGAQLGAHLSQRVHGDWIVRLLAVALAMVGLRVLLLAWQGGT